MKKKASLLAPWTLKKNKEHYEQLCDHKFDNLNEMYQFFWKTQSIKTRTSINK